MLGCSNSQHKQFAEEKSTNRWFTYLHGEEVQVQSIDDSVDTAAQDSKFLQRT